MMVLSFSVFRVVLLLMPSIGRYAVWLAVF
ncbi:hypothetical protein N802_04985 [Knoellia sinensis KCTC 19936]|uniref:Uncharacterized protein n=1 Tax=Knoellia sinensis KCTC 19936 TaxID=1385520 RepID=A0A0A0J1B9_9MICO|nr:hypothetical protein N802_04985 [Knoellia sinensis KCTC 19936]